MVSWEKLTNDAAKIDALLESFGQTYLQILDDDPVEKQQRKRACYAFYALRDIIEELVGEMRDFADTYELCERLGLFPYMTVKGEENNGCHKS